MSPGESCPSPSTAAKRHCLGITALTSPRQVASASYKAQGWQQWAALDAGPGFTMAAVWISEHELLL